MLLFILSISISCTQAAPALEPAVPDNIQVALPDALLNSDAALEQTLLLRRSIREYTDQALTLGDVSQLLWAAQGVTSEWGGRTAPSAGALYPLEVYLVAGNVENIAAGVYKYEPSEHALLQIKEGDVRETLAEAALSQSWIKEAAIDIVIAAVYKRTTEKYGDRGIRYVHIEVGHVAQNICLQAVARDLGLTPVGAFDDKRVKEIIGMSEDEAPLYIIPVGRKTASS